MNKIILLLRLDLVYTLYRLNNQACKGNFQYKISQKDTINQINFRITNQDNEEISTLGDWQLTMQLERHDEDMTESLLKQIKEALFDKFCF